MRRVTMSLMRRYAIDATPMSDRDHAARHQRQQPEFSPKEVTP